MCHCHSFAITDLALFSCVSLSLHVSQYSSAFLSPALHVIVSLAYQLLCCSLVPSPHPFYTPSIYLHLHILCSLVCISVQSWTLGLSLSSYLLNLPVSVFQLLSLNQLLIQPVVSFTRVNTQLILRQYGLFNNSTYIILRLKTHQFMEFACSPTACGFSLGTLVYTTPSQTQ